jgi:hypothetical protein
MAAIGCRGGGGGGNRCRECGSGSRMSNAVGEGIGESRRIQCPAVRRNHPWALSMLTRIGSAPARSAPPRILPPYLCAPCSSAQLHGRPPRAVEGYAPTDVREQESRWGEGGGGDVGESRGEHFSGQAGVRAGPKNFYVTSG